MKQMMDPFPLERLTPEFPPLIDATGAIYLNITHDYDTQTILLQYIYDTNFKGRSIKIVSDKTHVSQSRIEVEQKTEGDPVSLITNQLPIECKSTQRPHYNDEGSNPKKYANPKVGDVCQFKYTEGTQVLTTNKVKVGSPRSSLILPVIKHNLEERAWWTNESTLCANLKVGDVCQLKYVKGFQVHTTDEVKVGSQRSSLILPVVKQNLEERAWWTNDSILCANLKVSDVCQLKYVKGSQVFTTDEVKVRSQRLSLILPVVKQNLEERAWWTNDSILCANLKVGDVCQLKGSQVLITNEVEVGSQSLCLILPISQQNFEKQAWWTNGLVLWSAVIKIGNLKFVVKLRQDFFVRELCVV